MLKGLVNVRYTIKYIKYMKYMKYIIETFVAPIMEGRGGRGGRGGEGRGGEGRGGEGRGGEGRGGRMDGWMDGGGISGGMGREGYSSLVKAMMASSFWSNEAKRSSSTSMRPTNSRASLAIAFFVCAAISRATR